MKFNSIFLGGVDNNQRFNFHRKRICGKHRSQILIDFISIFPGGVDVFSRVQHAVSKHK